MISSPKNKLALALILFACASPSIARGSDEDAACDVPGRGEDPGFLMNDLLCREIGASPRELGSILEAVLKPRVKAFPKDVAFFHYGSEPKGSLQAYFKAATSSHFENWKPSSDVWGGGIYAESDPISTVNYAGDSPFLLRMDVPAGTKYLDARAGSNLFSTPAEAQAKELWCYLRNRCETESCRKSLDQRVDDAEGQRLWPYVDLNALTNEKGSRPVLERVFKKLGVGMIVDQFGVTPYSECRLNPDTYATGVDAIFVDPELAARVKLTPMRPKPDPENRKIYAETLAYFDALDCEESGRLNRPFRNPSVCENPKFWEFYRGWASALEGAPSDDFKEFQKKRAQAAKPGRRELTRKLFGCSSETGAP